MQNTLPRVENKTMKLVNRTKSAATYNSKTHPPLEQISEGRNGGEGGAYTMIKSDFEFPGNSQKIIGNAKRFFRSCRMRFSAPPIFFLKKKKFLFSKKNNGALQSYWNSLRSKFFPRWKIHYRNFVLIKNPPKWKLKKELFKTNLCYIAEQGGFSSSFPFHFSQNFREGEEGKGERALGILKFSYFFMPRWYLSTIIWLIKRQLFI